MPKVTRQLTDLLVTCSKSAVIMTSFSFRRIRLFNFGVLSEELVKHEMIDKLQHSTAQSKNKCKQILYHQICLSSFKLVGPFEVDEEDLLFMQKSSVTRWLYVIHLIPFIDAFLVGVDTFLVVRHPWVSRQFRIERVKTCIANALPETLQRRPEQSRRKGTLSAQHQLM